MKRLWITLGLRCLACLGCSGQANVHPAARQEPSPRAQVAVEEPRNYEPGPWWSADMSGLYVTAAHILVTHQESRPTGFLQYVRKSTRSKAEAVALAQQLRTQLARDPKRFAELAASSSDDRMSAEIGGELGTFRPANVMHALVDTLGHLAEGELSRVVESEVGFHIVKRLPAREDELVSYSHIVIKHGQSVGWRRSDRPPVQRSEEEARSLAAAVAAQAKLDPTRFVALVQQYSDADDVSRDGDAGEYSRYDDFGSDFVLLERARRLPEGAVSGAYESSSGYQILQRTAPKQRDELAASVISLPHQGAQVARHLPARRSQERAKQVADKLARELRAKPASFAERRLEYCEGFFCDATLRWRRGRELPALERAVSALAPGEVAAEAIDTPVGFLIVRREPTAARERPAPILDYRAIPPRKEPSGAQQPPNFRALIQNVGHYALPRMNLSEQRKRELAELFAQLDARLASEDSMRGNVALHLGWLEERLQALLGEDGYDAYDRHRRRYMAAHPR